MYKIAILFAYHGNCSNYETLRKELLAHLRFYDEKTLKTQNVFQNEDIYIDFITSKRNPMKLKIDFDEVVLADRFSSFNDAWVDKETNKFKNQTLDDICVKTNDYYIKNYSLRVFSRDNNFHSCFQLLQVLKLKISNIYGDIPKVYYSIERNYKIKELKFTKLELKNLYGNSSLYDSKDDAIEQVEKLIETEIKRMSKRIEELQDILIYEKYLD